MLSRQGGWQFCCKITGFDNRCEKHATKPGVLDNVQPPLWSPLLNTLSRMGGIAASIHVPIQAPVITTNDV